MNTIAQMKVWKGMKCVELKAGGYTAWIANEIGSNVIRLHDDVNGVEFFRFTDENTPQEIKGSAEVWGLPTLYLPNRFADGVLKTSDAVYQLPVNEKAPYNNHIHGFLHKRKHTVVSLEEGEDYAIAVTSYQYDEKDEFFQYLPIAFTATYTFKLSKNGLEYQVSFQNQSQKMMPMSLATHTTINAPFVDGGEEEDIRIQAPVLEKWVLNERCLPTLEILPLTEYDQAYVDGTTCPVKRIVDNDMYTATAQKDGFYGVRMTDCTNGKGIAYEVSDNYKFWILWNDRGEKHYFCPEPMTAMIDAPNLSLPAEQTGYTEVAPGETYTAKQHFSTIL